MDSHSKMVPARGGPDFLEEAWVLVDTQMYANQNEQSWTAKSTQTKMSSPKWIVRRHPGKYSWLI